MRNVLSLISVVGSVLWVTSALQGAEKAEEEIKPAAVELGRPVDFGKDLLPILRAKCIACHNKTVTESELILENVPAILKGGDNGTAVVAKDPDKSLLYLAAARTAEPFMPPLPNDKSAKPLTPKELGILRQWILEGATSGSGSTPIEIHWRPLPEGLKAIYAAALSPWGRWAATGRANRIAIYDLETGETAAQPVDPALTDIQFNGKPMYPGGAPHRDFVHALAFSPDGNLLASAGYRVVKLWKREKNAKKLQVATAQAVTAVAISADGTRLALGLADGSIQLTNLADNKDAKTLTGHTATVTGLAFLPITKDQPAEKPILVSSSQDKTIRLWNQSVLTAVGTIATPAAVNDVALSKDAAKVVSAGADNIIRVWNMADAAAADPNKPAVAVLEIKGHEKPVTAIALVLPDGAQLVSGSEDGTVRQWNLADGKQIRSMNHGGPVTAVDVRPDGQVAASAGGNNVAKLWKLKDGKQLSELKGDVGAQRQVSLLTEAKTVASQKVSHAGSGVKAAEKNSKDRTATAKKAKDAKAAADKAIEEAKKKEKAEADKLTAAKAELEKKKDDKALKKKVADAEKAATAATAAVKNAVTAQANAVRSQQLADKAVEAAGKRLEAAKTAKAKAEEHGKNVGKQLADAQKSAKATEKPMRSIAFSRDGKVIATAGDDNIVHLWNATNGHAMETLTGHSAVVASVAFGAHRTLVSGAGDKTAIVWNTRPGWALVGRLGANKEKPLDITASPFVSRVLALDFSDDGKLLATGGGDPSRSGELMIWNVADRSLVREIKDAHSDTVLGLEFSRDGKLILSGAADKFVKIFEVATGKHVRSFEGHTHHVLDVAWKADGTSIASAGADNAIKVWNVETGEQRRTIGGYSKQVTSIQYVGVGGNIVSCSGDKKVRFHKTSNGQNYRNFGGGTNFMYASAASRDEATVIAGGEDGVLRVWNGKDGKILATHNP